MFDQKTIEQIGCYVYALLDPNSGKPFYIGKGVGNRVFSHASDALENSDETDKLDKIREILRSGSTVRHIILRHGLTNDEALLVESSLIDLLEYLGYALTNAVNGHGANVDGLMTTDELERKFNAEPLVSLEHSAVIININKTYKRASGRAGIYEATRSCWAAAENRIKSMKYVLSEYRGLVVEVFEVEHWYEVPIQNGATRKIRWAFHGKPAADCVRNVYINKSLAHIKRPGAANPIRYCL